MSSINFRLYADQIYGLACSKIKDYITPEIEKEQFTTMFKEGQVKYDNIQSKQKISVHPQLTINNLQIEKLFLNIPNETENFSMSLSGVKTTVELFDIKENEIEQLIIEKRKSLVEKFIAFAVKKIENKESSKSFIEGLLENLINRAINGLKIELNNIELTIKYKNNIFVLSIENISYSEESGVQIKNFEFLYQEENNLKKKNYIIKKFNIEIEIKKAEDETGHNQINLKLSDFQFELNKNIFLGFNEIFNLIDNTKYKYIYVRYKKLIQYFRPIKPEFESKNENEENINTNNENNNLIEEKNKYYNSLWLYAIKSVIKLQKYVGYDKLYLLDLPDFIQSKISKKYVDDNNYTEKLILPSEINLLKATKEKVEKQVLDGKKGNVLSNAFSFFFGGKKDEDEKKELSEEEKQTFENIYTNEYLINYLSGKNKESNTQSNPIKEKIIGFISRLKINVYFNKLELILANDNVNKCTLYICDIKVMIEKLNDEINNVLTIGNIGSNLDKDLFNERMNINENNDLIMVTKDKNNKIKVDLGFKNIELSEDLFNFLLIFFSSLKTQKKSKIFKNVPYEIKNNEEKKNEEQKTEEQKVEKAENVEKPENLEKDEIEQKVENEEKVEKKDDNKDLAMNNEICNNFSISNIPSLVISNNGNKTIFSLINYSITPSKIEFTFNIKDSFGTILDNYTFIFNKDEKTYKYSLNLQQPLRILISSESSKLLFISLLKLQERIKQIQKRNKTPKKEISNKNEDSEQEKDLFGFNYVIHKKLDIKNFNINELIIEIIMEKITIEIFENTVKSKFSISNFNLTYENRNLLLKIGKCSVKTNLMSTMIIYLADFKSPNFHEFQKYIDNVKNEYEHYYEEIVEKTDENKDEADIKYDFNIDYFLNSFKVYINLFIFSFQADNNIISYAFNKIRVQKVEKDIIVKLGCINLSFRNNEKNSKNLKIFNIDEDTSVNFDPKINLAIVKISHPKLNIDLETFKNIQKSYQYLMEQVDLEVIICKVNLKILDSYVKLNNQFNFSVSEILVKNFDDENSGTFYFTINDFLVKNKNNEFITGQNKININVTTKTITDYSITVNFSDLNVNLSKTDINNLSKILIENKDKDIQNNKEIIYFKENASKKKESHEFNISFVGKIPLIDICLCSEKRFKKCELVLSPLEVNTKIFIPANFQNVNDIQKNIKMALGKLNLSYNDDNNEEYYIVEYKGKEDYGYDFVEKNMISFEPNLYKINQIEINLNNEKNKDVNEIEMNINKIGVNLKLNILNKILLYIKDILPKNKLKQDEKNKNKEIVLDNKKESEIKLNLNFNEIQFKFESINNNMGEINININKINYCFNSMKDKNLPCGIFEAKLDQLLIVLNNSDEINKILNTKKDFISIKGDIKEDSSEVNILMSEMMINLSFTDINLIKDIISSNCSFYNKNKNNLLLLLNKEKEKEEKEEEITNKPFSLNYDMKSLDFTLIDNYSNMYQPFLNLKLNNLCSILTDKKALNSSLYIALLTYNYISSVWEPIIENSCIKSMFLQKEENNSIVNSFKIEIYQLLLNISDMFISSTVLSLNNLNKILDTNRAISQNNELNTSRSRFSSSMSSVFSSALKDLDMPPPKKQTNNKIVNYTGKDLKILFNNKTYNCGHSSETDLEYINKWDKNKDEKKKIKIYYDNDTIIDIPFGKLGIDCYELSNGQFLVWENTISLDRQININLYSQIIIKNKTNNNFHIKVMNKSLGNLFILLKPNSKSGIPLTYCNHDTSFILKIIGKEINNNSFSQNDNVIKLKDILNLPDEENYQQKINLQNKSLLLKLQRKIDKVSTLLITTEYSIINCLPCDILLQAKNRNEKIKKCSQFLIDFSSDSELEIKLIVKTLTDYYISEPIKLYLLTKNYAKYYENNETKNIILFINQKGQSFNLSFLLKNKDYHKSLILYSEYFLYNDSGINFNSYSNFLFSITENIYLISNKIYLEGSNIQLSYNDFSSQNINLQEVIKASPYYQLSLSNGNYNNLYLSIKKKISFISIRNKPNFRENIISMIFVILPICKIVNLFSNKKLLLRDYKDNNQNMIIPPLNEVSFNFFNKDKNNSVIELGLINANENKCNATCLFNLFKCGIYTFFSEKDFFNLEIKDSSSEGLLNVFVTETTLQNAKIIVINKTKMNFEIYQNNYDNHRQIINENDSHIIKIYDQNNISFFVEIGGKRYGCNFTPFKEEFNVYPVENKFILVSESNGVKMKIILYIKSEYEKLNKKERNLYANVIINNCFISLIGDNFDKDRKLRNYERNEILLFYFQNLNTKLTVNKSKETIHKKNILLNLNLSKMEIFNQLSKKGKFSCIFKNMVAPCMNFVEELDLYNEDYVAKINKFIFNMNKLQLNIDPEFILEIINFAENIAYRLGKINFNVDKIFLRTNKNIRDIKIKKNIEKYKNHKKLICFGSEFNFPSINIDYELTEINLEKLLREKVGCTDLLVWLGFGLVRQNQNIYLDKFTINNYFGDFAGLMKKMQDNYKSQMTSVILNMGFRGLIGQIKQLFVNDKTDENSIDVQKNRIRYPRAFYGKYNYIKNYNEEEAKIIEKIIFTYQKDFKEIFCNNILQSRNYIFYFSGSSLFIFKKNYELHYKIDYKTIDNVYNNGDNLIIKYKTENDEESPSSIVKCDEIQIAKKIVKYFNNFVDTI